MARFLFVTWDGGGNQPPTIGIAQALSRRGNEVAFAGYRSQQDRFRAAGFDLLELPRSGGVDLDVAALSEQRPLVLTGVMASREHLGDIPEVTARMRPDLLIVDCMMFSALTAAESLDGSWVGTPSYRQAARRLQSETPPPPAPRAQLRSWSGWLRPGRSPGRRWPTLEERPAACRSRATASSIINIGSVASQLGSADNAAYGATKAALASMTRAWAAEFGRAGYG